MRAFYNATMRTADETLLASSRIDAGGVRVHALVREGPDPVVFVHGLSASSAYFADAGERTELAGRGIVALDLPGYGDSTAPAGFGFRMREQADVVVAVIRALALDRVTLVGHSMGGTIALLASDALAARLEAIVLAEAIVVFDETLWSERISSVTLDDWRTEFASVCRRPDTYARGSLLRRRREAVERIAPCVLKTTAEAMHASATDLQAVVRDPDFYARFVARTPAPTYVFGDVHASTRFCRQIRADGVRVEIVPGAGHLMMLDNPDAFYAIVASAGRSAGTPA